MLMKRKIHFSLKEVWVYQIGGSNVSFWSPSGKRSNIDVAKFWNTSWEKMGEHTYPITPSLIRDYIDAHRGELS